MADKETKLSIVIRTVDKATAKIKAISDRLDAVTKPIRDFKEALGDLREKSGLDDVIGGFKGVGGAIKDILSKLLVVGGVVGGLVVGMFHLVGEFDDLGDKAEALGVGVDFLAQMRYAAEKSGASVEQLDAGLQGFTASLGQARAGTGRMASFLTKVSPALLRQLKAAKGNEQAFDLLADAMIKIEDPAKRAAFAQKTLGDSALAPLLVRGSKGIKDLRRRYLELAGSQEGAVDEAGKVDDSMHDLKASITGVKAALVEGLSPALKQLVEELRAWFAENRERIGEWAKDLGHKLPGAIHRFVDGFLNAIDGIQEFIEKIGGIKTVAVALAAVIVGPLVASIYTLGVALLTTPVGWIVAGIAAIAAGAYLVIKNWDLLSGFFSEMWDKITGKFAWAKALIKLAMWPVLGIATALMLAWQNVGDFFHALWDGITSAFQKAWEVISSIVDKIVGAVDKVLGAANAVGNAIGGSILPPEFRAQLGLDQKNDLSGLLAAGRGAASSTQAKVTIDIANAPRGTRVNADPKSTADVDLSVGYQLLPGVL